jgi:hypothetical protein
MVVAPIWANPMSALTYKTSISCKLCPSFESISIVLVIGMADDGEEIKGALLPLVAYASSRRVWDQRRNRSVAFSLV